MRKLLLSLFLSLTLTFVSACDDGGDKNNVNNTINANNTNNVNNFGCTVGDEASATFDATGGVLTLCGASVTVDAGSLTEALGVTLRVVETPADVPYPFEAAGPAFELTLDGVVPHVTPQALSILVPHGITTRHVFFYRHTAAFGWEEVEACTAGAEIIGQRMSVSGTYMALADTVDFPGDLDGLGSGTLVSGFPGEDRTWDLDADEIDTYAIYNEGEDGTRGITLSATVLDDEGNLAVLNLKLGASPEGEGGVLQINFGNTADPDGYWVFGPFEETANFTIVSMEGETLQGVVVAPVTRADVTETLTVEIDVTMELYRYAPELVCEDAGG